MIDLMNPQELERSRATFPVPRRRYPLAAIALATLSGLGGCSMIPKYDRPAAPVAPMFSGDTAPIAGTPASGANNASNAAQTPAWDIDWRAYFIDPRLRRLIEMSLANNRDLRTAVLNIEAARAQYDIRRADRLPTVGAGLQATRTPVASGTTVTTYSAGLTVSAFELDFFGRVRSLSEAALQQYLGTREARKTAQISLISAVATTYVAILADDDLLDVTRQTIQTRLESQRLTKLKFDNGAASELDYRATESLLEAANATLAQTLRQRAQDENALVLLIGAPLPADLPPALRLANQQLLPDLPAGVPSEVLARRPDVRQAEQTLIAANANIGAARAAFFPSISLTGTVGSASTQLDNLFKGGTYAWTGTGQLLQPLFNAGRNQANLEVAQVQRDIAVANYEKAIQTAFREVSDSLAGRATLGEQLRAQQAQANAEQIRFKLSDLRYRNGASSYLDVLDAQRSLFVAQQGTVQVQALQVQNLVTLYKVLGGGWKE